MAPAENSKDRYPMLVLASRCYKIAAWLVIPYFLFQSYVLLSNFGNNGLSGVFLVAVYCAVAFITLYAFSEGILLFIDIEDNTRRQADKPIHSTVQTATSPAPATPEFQIS
jgi:hypothetical protein